MMVDSSGVITLPCQGTPTAPPGMNAGKKEEIKNIKSALSKKLRWRFKAQDIKMHNKMYLRRLGNLAS